MLVMRGIAKAFGPVRANRGIDFSVPRRRIVGLLGENGSGKTTLMNILLGMAAPDAGTIELEGQPLAGHTPHEALARGVAMIHQHFTLVDAMTVAENVMLGWDAAGAWLRHAAVAERIRRASRAYGLDLDPTAIVETLSLGARQRVEIVKAVLRGARLLVLDEPTSNLSPPEVARLFDVLRTLRDEDRSVVFISHKLGEVLEICDEVVVLRAGEVAGRRPVAGASRDDLARMMIGTLPPPLERATVAPGRALLAVFDLHARDDLGVERLRGVSLSVRAGEILAIAGVDGNGQGELAEVIGGVRPATRGSVAVDGADVTEAGVTARISAGLAYVPADRLATGLVPAMTVAENLALRDVGDPPFRRGPWLDLEATRALARQRIGAFGILASGAEAPVATLSGGNQQKVVLARELGRAPKVLVAVQPTRGLDPGASRDVIDRVLAMRAAGGAVLYISTELDEVLTVGDRIAVMYGGEILGVVDRDEADLGRIGLMMAGTRP
jgi:simple sugar transport system ATP-binding protein